jgi:hypothetical protein
MISPVGARRSIPVCPNVMEEVCLGHIQFVIFNYAAKRDGPRRGGLAKDNGSQCARTYYTCQIKGVLLLNLR